MALPCFLPGKVAPGPLRALLYWLLQEAPPPSGNSPPSLVPLSVSLCPELQRAHVRCFPKLSLASDWAAGCCPAAGKQDPRLSFGESCNPDNAPPGDRLTRTSLEGRLAKSGVRLLQVSGRFLITELRGHKARRSFRWCFKVGTPEERLGRVAPNCRGPAGEPLGEGELFCWVP